MTHVKLRPFQAELERQVYAAWNEPHVTDVLAVSATGSGKTVLFSKFIRDEPGGSLAVAHRKELVSQSSIALARNDVRHKIIGPPALSSNCAAIQRIELGYSYIDGNARCAVAGVDSLKGAYAKDPKWFDNVRLVVQDEAHHVLRENKWGRGRRLLKHARALHVTATPGRPDRRGLGREAAGFIDRMVMAPGMREIIDMGYLTDYQIACVDSDVDVSNIGVGKDGEFLQAKLADAVHRSTTMVGSVVDTYLRLARGKLGITFAVDVEEASKLAAAYRAAGIPAEVVHAETPDLLRTDIIRKFRRREILQLVNVDLFGEGFDLPAIEVVSMARHTASFIVYAQQFGRALRLMIDPTLLAHWDGYTDAERRYWISISAKPRALIIDHVGNMVRHDGPPDKPRAWSLDGGAAAPTEYTPYRVCSNTMCQAPFLRVLSQCPYCKRVVPPPTARDTPAAVDGVIHLLDDAVLAALRGEVAHALGSQPKYPRGATEAITGRLYNLHMERQRSIHKLRVAMDWWSGLQNALGHTDLDEQMRRFYFAFGVDVASALALPRMEADALHQRIGVDLARLGIDASVNI